MLKAILNELQPFRWKDITDSIAWVASESRWLSQWITESISSLLDTDFQAIVTNKANQSLLAIIICWCIGYNIFLQAEFASLYVIISLFAMIFLNLGERKAGEMSAYSVFNEGFVALQGTLRGEDLDREIRHQQHLNIDDEEESDDSNDDADEHMTLFEDEINEPASNKPDNNSSDSTSFAARLRLRQMPRS